MLTMSTDLDLNIFSVFIPASHLTSAFISDRANAKELKAKTEADQIDGWAMKMEVMCDVDRVCFRLISTHVIQHPRPVGSAPSNVMLHYDNYMFSVACLFTNYSHCDTERVLKS